MDQVIASQDICNGQAHRILVELPRLVVTYVFMHIKACSKKVGKVGETIARRLNKTVACTNFGVKYH